MTQDARNALNRFVLENEIIDEANLYDFDEEEANRLYKEKPWKKE